MPVTVIWFVSLNMNRLTYMHHKDGEHMRLEWTTTTKARDLRSNIGTCTKRKSVKRARKRKGNHKYQLKKGAAAVWSLDSQMLHVICLCHLLPLPQGNRRTARSRAHIRPPACEAFFKGNVFVYTLSPVYMRFLKKSYISFSFYV
jgi:hypothetical protein